MPPTELPLSAGCASPNTVVARSGLGAVSDQPHSQTNKLSNRRQQRPELSRVAKALSYTEAFENEVQGRLKPFAHASYNAAL